MIEVAILRAAKRMGVTVGESAISQLNGYADELRRWNRAYNLVGRNIGIDGMLWLYVDSISPLCIKGLLEEGKEVLDLGCGAGLPGIPLYITAGPFNLTLVESQRKKITFLRHVCRKFEMEDVSIYGGRMEDLAREEDKLSAYDVVFSRALMEPLRLMRKVRALVSDGGKVILFVGKKDADRVRRTKMDLVGKGMVLEAIRSTKRITGKENYLAVIRKE
ncbi:MAG: 16S rRNA (guanine(527)-N(7))-methyltransferase RsmG [Actinomycetota bacterium]|nr:16S rRNA (guanine(527)-N(7))-methyltransferase RsmG [Actinomycetota bacterium]